MLFGCELEHEIRREPLTVAFYMFIEPLYGYAVKFSQIGIKDYLVLAQNEDPGFYRKARAALDFDMNFDWFLRSQIATSIIAMQEEVREPEGQFEPCSLGLTLQITQLQITDSQVMLTSVYVPYTCRKASQISPTVA